jgi:hypothetical protein
MYFNKFLNNMEIIDPASPPFIKVGERGKMHESKKCVSKEILPEENRNERDTDDQ